MRHLTIRVAWHDNRWNGTICTAPSRNSYCVTLDRVREGRNDAQEDALAGRAWGELKRDELPPCIGESAGFMNERSWARTFDHIYRALPKAQKTHGDLRPTRVPVEPFTTFAVPFWWMLKQNQRQIEESSPEPLPTDAEAPFDSAWVFGRARQEELSKRFFNQLTPEQSLVFFYTKEGQPLGEMLSRLVVGIGRVTSVGAVQFYDHYGEATYPFWDRQIRHSIRPDGHDGLLLPYHDYLAPTGDPDEDARRRALLAEIAVAVDAAHVRTFSYAAELATPDVALSTLTRCLDAVRLIRTHGIAKGPWDLREEWLNEQIAHAWRDRGAFPGLGSVLEALGMRLGTALAMDLVQSDAIKSDDDPWPVVDAMLRGTITPPRPSYAADLAAVRQTWIALPEERRALLKLLSRLDLTPNQAKRWYDLGKRAKATSNAVDDAGILANPYRMAEVDLGSDGEPPVSVSLLDRGLFPDDTIRVHHPIPSPSAVESPNDFRRIRAALVNVLSHAADDGDTLLSTTEALERLVDLKLTYPCGVGADWISAHKAQLEDTIAVLELPAPAPSAPPVSALQLVPLQQREQWLRKRLDARARAPLPSLKQDWTTLLIGAIGEDYIPDNLRHREALKEQAEALERITARKLTALTGRAGTGKTTVMGALFQSPTLKDGGILLLAPTGKARVKLAHVVKGAAEALTIAQFLYRLHRYDGEHQRPLFNGDIYRQEKTVVIDECSMLTLDDLFAVLNALDLAHVQRLILVGDPNQLPPIGAGRPFADLVTYLEQAEGSANPETQVLAGAMGRLDVEVRARAEGTPSDTLRLAAWFTRDPLPVDADRILEQVAPGGSFNDLDISFWRAPEDLRERLLEKLQERLGLSHRTDVEGFNRALGFNEQGWVPYEAPDGVEHFQILSPTRLQPYGVHDLNRWIQRQFRAKELQNAHKWNESLGDEEIVVRDKIIQVQNQSRKCYSRSTKQDETIALANGEIGAVAHFKHPWFNVVFAGRPNITVGYRRSQFSESGHPLELAYALTVHKAQGSDFDIVFVVLPEKNPLLSRELLYTALTRSRDRLVLLVQGDNASFLHGLTLPEKSETAHRNTNLFQGVVRERVDLVPYAENLIHRTQHGQMVRSKSELVIANMLEDLGVPYTYERPLEGTIDPGRKYPDFTFADPAGEPVVWEHLGMMGRPDYRDGWQAKLAWYNKNGFALGQNLFTTQDDERGGLDATEVRRVAEKIKALIE